MLPQWCVPPASMALEKGEIHLWLAGLDDPVINAAAIGANVSADEHLHAERLLCAQTRQRYLATRALQKRLLSYYLNVPVQQVVVCHHPNGKPFVMGTGDTRPPEFNLAHAANIALFALSREHPVGVDIERMDAHTDLKQLAAVCLTDREYTTFCGTAAAHQRALFYHYWTCKEAYLKAAGRTLNDLRQINVVPDADPASAHIHIEDMGRSTPWTIHAWAPLPGFAAAVAVADTTARLRFWKA